MAQFEAQEEAAGISPGMEWCSGGNAWLLERARAAGLDPRDFYGEKAARLYTPFERCYVACFRGKLAAATRALDDEGDAGARALLATGAEKSGWTPLHAAAFHGHDELVALALARGAAVDAPNALGQTALHLACKQGHERVVERLVAAGADVARRTAGNRYVAGNTPLEMARRFDHEAIVALLSTGEPASEPAEEPAPDAGSG